MLRAKNLAKGIGIQYTKRKSRFETTEGATLPESYKKFFREFKYEKAKPIHWIKEQGRYKYDEDGKIVPVINVPIPISYAKEQDEGIWGGESVIRGFRRAKHKYECPVPEYWVPKLLDHIVYSEILDKYLNVPVTQRTINLIHEHIGFDNYILKSRACELASLLACKIKKKILTALYYKTLYPDNEEKREEIYNKYKEFLEGYTEEDIEWYGLSYEEAVLKNRKLVKENEEKAKVPLKIIFRQELINELKQMKLDGTFEKEENKKNPSLLQKFNPFAKVSD